MPELPEVEVVRLGLQAHVAGREIAKVEVLHERAIRRHTLGGNDFTGRLAGHKLKPGSYRLVATPRVGAMTGRAASASFRIVS